MTNTIITQKTASRDTLSCPEYIYQKHWDEWIQSGVKPSIIAKSIYTEEDSRELDKTLSRNTKRRHKHSDNLVPAWVVRGVDPQTGELTLNGVQAKPDNPEVKEGKIQKYIGAYGYDAAPLFLKTDDDEYWERIIREINIPLFITEGAKKAGCLISNGYAAISIPGVSTCRKNGRLHELLKLLCKFGRTIYLCFDNDITSKRTVQQALINLSIELASSGSKVMVVCLPDGEAKGVDDFIVAKGKEAFEEVVQNSKTIEEWKETNDLNWAAQQEQIKKTKKSKLGRTIEIISKAWGGFLQWNKLTQSPELSGEPLDAEELKVKIALELDTDVGKDDAIASISFLSKKQSYHPIQEYLEDVARRFPEEKGCLDNISSEFFGNNSPICDIYMKRFLIASVARAMKPGEKVDTAVLLYGAEGVKKSSFWSVLFGEDWFSDSMDGENVKDEKMLIHNYWCLEWSEFTTVYRRKDIESLKKFLAQKDDSFRKPYDRTISKHKRSCVFVGTTNTPEVLQDASGRNRRFWIINVKTKQIDIPKLENLRDRIWAAAYHAWKRGEIFYIPEHSPEAELQDRENEQYKVKHPWHELIEGFLEDKESTHLAELYDFLEIEKGRREAKHDRIIRECLKLMGWEQTDARGSYKGTRPRLWKISTQSKKSTGILVQMASNPYTAVVSDVPETVPETVPDNFAGSALNSEVEQKNEHPQKQDTDQGTVPDKFENNGLVQCLVHPEPAPSNGYAPFVPESQYFDQNEFKNKKAEKTAIKSIHPSPLGEVKAIATPGGEDGGHSIELQFPGLEPYHTSTACKDMEKLPSVIRQWVKRYLKRLDYQIHIITAPPGQYEWVDASLVEYRPNEYDHRKDKWVFLREGHEYAISDLELIRLKPNA